VKAKRIDLGIQRPKFVVELPNLIHINNISLLTG